MRRTQTNKDVYKRQGVMWEIILQTMEDVTISDLVKRAMENAGSIKTEYGRMS